MADRKYLKRRGERWHLQVPVPAALREQLGRRCIEKSLMTGDLVTARLRRDQILPSIRAWYASLLQPATWNPESIARELMLGHQGAAVEALQEEIARRALEQPIPGRLDGPDGDAALRALAIVQGQPEGIHLSTAVERHLEAITRLSASAQRNRRVALQSLLAAVGDRALASVSRADIAGWLQGLVSTGRTLSTARLYGVQASALWHWAIAAGLTEANPVTGAARTLVGRDQHEPRRGFTDAELQLLMPTLDAELHRLAMVGLHSGLRIGELMTAEVRDGLIRVTRSKTEAGQRIVPVHSRVAELLPEGRQLFRAWRSAKAAGAAFSRACRAVELPPALTFHSCRHAFAQKLRDASVPVEILSALLGHKPVGVTLSVYARAAPLEQLKDAVESIHYQL